MMVKINLLPDKGTRRGRKRKKVSAAGAADNLMTGFLVLIILQLGGMYYWYMATEEAVQHAGMGSGELSKEKTSLETLMAKVREVKLAGNAVAEQRLVFDGIDQGKLGPLNTLLFMSYALRRVDVSLPDEEYEGLTKVWTSQKDSSMAAGEQQWNPDTIWITRIVDKNGHVEIEGSAKNHEDVMTFLRRLKSGVYFEGLDLVYQKMEDNVLLGLPYVDFKLSGMLNYNLGGYPPVPVK